MLSGAKPLLQVWKTSKVSASAVVGLPDPAACLKEQATSMRLWLAEGDRAEAQRPLQTVIFQRRLCSARGRTSLTLMLLAHSK